MPVEARAIATSEQVRYVVRVSPQLRARAVGRAAALQAQRSARKLPHLRVEVDPAELG